jgi:hypothetical protein
VIVEHAEFDAELLAELPNGDVADVLRGRCHQARLATAAGV